MDIDLKLSVEDQQILFEAVHGQRGESQKKIAEIGLSWITLLLRKNQDYGDTIFDPPKLKPSLSAADAILVRASDKISRIAQLSSGDKALIAETLEDSFRDLGAYCLLYLCRRK